MSCNTLCWPYWMTAYTELTVLDITVHSDIIWKLGILTLINITKPFSSACPNIDVTKIHTIFVHTTSALTNCILQYEQNWDILFSHSCAPWTLTLLHHLHCCENLGVHKKYVKWKHISKCHWRKMSTQGGLLMRTYKYATFLMIFKTVNFRYEGLICKSTFYFGYSPEIFCIMCPPLHRGLWVQKAHKAH